MDLLSRLVRSGTRLRSTTERAVTVRAPAPKTAKAPPDMKSSWPVSCRISSQTAPTYVVGKAIRYAAAIARPRTPSGQFMEDSMRLDQGRDQGSIGEETGGGW